MSVGELEDLVIAEVGAKRFGFPVNLVREVLWMLEFIPMPDWPENCLGLIEIRGELLPLVDVAPSLGQAPMTFAPEQFIVILSAAGRSIGVAVRAVVGVRSTVVRTSLPLNSELQGLCRGVALEAEGAVVVLDVDRLLARLKLPEGAWRGPREATR
jgi:chemotaxis signal transduction protein